MRHRKKRWSGRAREASAEDVFERALFGADTVEADRPRWDPKCDRKTLQLCRQVQRALIVSLDGERAAADVLADVSVDTVEPMGGPSHLLVRVTVPAESNVSAAAVMARLEAEAPRLRAVVADSISRERVPGLSFVAVPATQGGSEGGTS